MASSGGSREPAPAYPQTPAPPPSHEQASDDEPWSGDAAEAARLGRELALSRISAGVLEQVAEVVRLAGVQAVAALGPAVLRDPWGGRVLADALRRAAEAGTGLAHDADVVRWLQATSLVLALLGSKEEPDVDPLDLAGRPAGEGQR